MKQGQNQISFEDILESLAEGVIAVDTEMQVSVYNQSAEKITEISRSLILGKPLEACFRRNPRIAEMLRKTLTDGRLFTEYDEKLFRRITGDTIPIGVTTSQVVDARGELVGAAALIRDLSGLKSLEAGSLRKERLAYIGTFAASLAHEIRNPLSGIRGAAQLLSRKVKEPNLSEYMEVIIKEADRLNVILNDMLDFARPAKLNRAPANIHQVLDSVVFLLQEGAGPNTFVKSYDPEHTRRIRGREPVEAGIPQPRQERERGDLREREHTHNNKGDNRVPPCRGQRAGAHGIDSSLGQRLRNKA